MRHFIAYHNTEHMGRSLHEGDPLRLLTNKAVQHLLHNAVWFVQGDGKAPKQYSLGSFFVVSETGETGGPEFKWYASGRGHIFQPLVPMNELDWFPDFFKSVAHFSMGAREIQETRYIQNLRAISAAAGFELSG